MEPRKERFTVMTLEHKKDIIRWIMDNPGYVYARFTFKPEYDGEVLPTAEEFEVLTYNIDNWVEEENTELSTGEQTMYPGAIHRFKYIFSPLNGTLYAHVFTGVNNIIQYVVVLT